jgi:hypothetical protein
MENVLSMEKMSHVNGGTIMGGFCVAVGVADVASVFISLTGVGFWALVAANTACTIYAASQLS